MEGDIRPEERAFADLEELAPGSAGFYFDAGKLVVMGKSTDFLRVSAAVRELRLKGAFGKRDGSEPLTVRSAQFTFSQLRQWRDLVFANLLGRSGVISLDLDERRNRVVIGFDPTKGGRGLVMSQLSALGINSSATLVEDQTPLEPDTRSLFRAFPNIDQNADTIVGGYGCLAGTVNLCTIGFVADRSGQRDVTPYSGPEITSVRVSEVRRLLLVVQGIGQGQRVGVGRDGWIWTEVSSWL